MPKVKNHKLRQAGGSLIMTLPKAFIEQNHLHAGSQVELVTDGATITVKAMTATNKPHYTLAELIAGMPGAGLPMVEEWDGLKRVGREFW